MKTQELIKLLKKNRCYILPRHKAEIPIGTLKNILNDAGVSR